MPVIGLGFTDHLPSKAEIFEYWKDRLRVWAALLIGANRGVGLVDFITAPDTTSNGLALIGTKF